MKTIQNSRICKHLKSEEQYICLFEQCVKDQELKLDCLKCLQQKHEAHDNIEHVEDILLEAQENQKVFSQLIDENLKFCEDLKQQLEQTSEGMKQKFFQWVDGQTKTSRDQIEKYEVILNESKEKITTTQLAKEYLQNIIEFKLYDAQYYEFQNCEIQKTLNNNQKRFNEYFSVQFERLQGNYKCDVVGELPAIKTTFRSPKQIKFEKCTAPGCGDDDRTKLCREKSCLLKEDLCLECPTCQTMKHCAEKKESHKQYFISANDLWVLQNKLIDEVEQFCEKKEQEIEQESESLQSVIVECQKLNEIKLQQFRNFIVDKEKEIKVALKKFKSLYQKEEFTIYKDLLLKTDFSLLADIIQIEENFKNICSSFKEQFANEKELNQEQFQTLWLQGNCQLQKQNIQKIKDFVNPVSKHIQELNNQIINLTAKNQYTSKNESSQQDAGISSLLKAQSYTLDSIKNDQDQLSQKFDDLKNVILSYQLPEIDGLP